MTVQQFPPALVADLGGVAGRVDYIGEQDRRQYPVGLWRRPLSGQGFLDLVDECVCVANEMQMSIARQLDVFRARNVFRAISARFD